MDFKKEIAEAVATKLSEITPTEAGQVLINLTDPNFPGDYTVVLFPFIKSTGKNPQELGEWLGNALKEQLDYVRDFHLVKGFLNVEIRPETWNAWFTQHYDQKKFGFQAPESRQSAVLIEYPSPNTNKPLHLGHLRNIFLGSSLARILEAGGYKVYTVCLYNDRGTNISKSMLMYKRADNKITPESSGVKPDKLVAEYYVQYNKALKAELQSLVTSGIPEGEAQKKSSLEKEVADLTVKWEENDPETRALWEMMNGWFYKGVNETYQSLHLSFDKFYYESDVYNLGKETVKEGLAKGIFYQKPDGSIAIDLTDIGLDEKVVLRSNGTSVYITQDMALVYQKEKDFDFDRSVYVVGNEQEYHFKVLFEILRRLGLKSSSHLYHLSYGMVELPTGKMKSREGTVVDADDLIAEVVRIARETADEQGKLAEVAEAGRNEIYEQIGLGALRYFILKVDPKKKMIYNPKESIDFNGNTAPFIQYTHARTQSLLRNAQSAGLSVSLNPVTGGQYKVNEKEARLLRLLNEFPYTIEQSGREYSPALVANYVYQLASDFSTYYHDYKIIKEENEQARNFRISLAAMVGNTLKNALYLLGIDAPERM